MLYDLYEMHRAALAPLGWAADATQMVFSHPGMPFDIPRTGTGGPRGVADPDR